MYKELVGATSTSIKIGHQYTKLMAKSKDCLHRVYFQIKAAPVKLLVFCWYLLRHFYRDNTQVLDYLSLIQIGGFSAVAHHDGIHVQSYTKTEAAATLEFILYPKHDKTPLL